MKNTMRTTGASGVNYKGTAHAEGRPLWERAEGESAKAFEAFSIYRDLPLDERSLSAVAERLRKSKNLCARWSTQYQWVARVNVWSDHQDEMKRKLLAQEREKTLERQLQQNRIASQALMAPLIALAKRVQTKADPFAGASELELAKVASYAARALPKIHEGERSFLEPPEEQSHKQEQNQPLQIIPEGIRWVERTCPCATAGATTREKMSTDCINTIAL
jgi:hypothetical protein